MEWMTPSALTPSTIFATRFCMPLGTPESCSPSAWRRESTRRVPSAVACGRGENATANAGRPFARPRHVLPAHPRGNKTRRTCRPAEKPCRRIAIAPMHLSRFAQQQSAALFAVDAHPTKAFAELGAQGTQAVVILVHALRQLLSGVGTPRCSRKQGKRQQHKPGAY